MGLSGGNLTPENAEWRSYLADDPDTITRILDGMRRIAVIGIKTADSGGPAYSIPAYLLRHGYDVVPVPVYYPEVTEILGIPVHRSLSTVVPPADMVQLFRRSHDVPKHLDEILAAKPKAVWMQQGIWNDEVAEALARAGIHVIQDHCMQVELSHRHNHGPVVCDINTR